MPDICDYEVATYRKSFWENKRREFEDGAEHAALKSLLPRGDRIIDLGAGFGRMADLYKDYKQVVLLDYSTNHLEDALAHYGTERFIYVAADIYHLPFAPAYFDTAVMIRTLHHMDSPLAAIQQVRQILRQHGTYIVEFTNKRSLKTILKWMLSAGKQDYPFSQDPVEFDKLYFGFHPSFVHDKLKLAGFKPNRRLAASYLRVKPLKRVIPTEMLIKMDAMLQGTGRFGVLSPSVFIKSEAVSADPAVKGNSMWRCPSCCHLELEETPDAMTCPNCGNRYDIKNGIYDFRAAAAESHHVPVDTTTAWGHG